MNRIAAILALAFTMIFAVPELAHAGNTQVDQDAYRSTGRTGAYHGRSDGVFQEVNSKGLVIVGNGTSGEPIGVAYRETFPYGAGLGIAQYAWATGLTSGGATTTVAQLLQAGSGARLMWAPVVTQTLSLAMVATGLDIAADLVDDDGLEIWGGTLGGTGRPLVVGDDPAFYFCLTTYMTDVSGTDDYHIGFRNVEAMNAVFDDYANLASIGHISGNIYIETIIGGAGTVSTDTTNNWADTTSVALCVYVSDAGVVTYTIDGAAPLVTAALTLTDGMSVIPFVHHLHAADLAEATILTLWEVGYTE